MIAIDDINDRDSLKQWLDEWPAENGLGDTAARAIAVSIAHRAAMRVLPIWWEWTLGERARKLDLTALPVLRCNLISGVAGHALTPEIRIAAANVVNDASFAASTANAVAIADIATFIAADVTFIAIGTVTTADAADTAADAARLAATARRGLWIKIGADCRLVADNQDVLSAPLWGEVDWKLGNRWREIKLQFPGPEWDFWIKWYDDALAGGAPNWDMLAKIALIEPPVWEEGPKAVAAEIARIERELLGAQDHHATPEATLAANAKVIGLQLDALTLFVEEEIRKFRGQNDIPDRVLMRIELLETVLGAVAKLQMAFTEGASTGENALVVIEKNLPLVINAAEDLAEDSETPEVGETIILMGATIEHLTKCGTPGHLATGIAGLVVAWNSVGRLWRKMSKPTEGS